MAERLKTFEKTEVCLAKKSLPNKLPRSFVSIDEKTKDNLVAPLADGPAGSISCLYATPIRKRWAAAGHEQHAEDVCAHDFLFCDHVGAVDPSTAEKTTCA